MGKYKSLIANTLIFGIGTFSSKLLVFLLLPLLTAILSTEQLGVADYIITICNLILPVMYLSISEAVIRFGLDHAVRKRDVFTTGICTVLLGYGLFWCLRPLLLHFLSESLHQYVWLIYLYVLTSAMRTVITHFVRASGFVRLFALDGMFTTLTTLGFILLLMVKLEMGIVGYVLATICADGLSAVCLFLFLRLHRFIRLRGLDLSVTVSMLRYSMPLMFTAVFWWFTNLSDRFFIRQSWGDGLNGIYTISAKLPTMITLVSTIFTQAWQLSAFTEYQDPEGAKFFSSVFRSYYTFVFLGASGIIVVCKPLLTLMAQQESYYEAWRYVPFLVMAVSFSCLVTFLGTIYNAVRHNGMVIVTTALGAGLNILLNFLLIPTQGAQGAAFATFVSYFLVFVVRAVDTRKYIPIRMQPPRIALNLALLLFQIWIALREMPMGVLYQLLIFLLILICNLGNILFLLRRLTELLGSFLHRSAGTDS